MARPKAPDHEHQRSRILAQAVRAFSEVGYPSASMAQLAQACGTSKAGLYHYYPSKEALLFDALDRHTRRLLEVTVQARARTGTPREKLAGLVRDLLVEYRDSHDVHIALLNDVKFLAPPQRERIKEQERAVVRHFGQALHEAYPQRIPAASASPVTMALLGMINFTFAWMHPDGAMSYEQFADLVIDLWERGLDVRAEKPAASIQA